MTDSLFTRFERREIIIWTTDDQETFRVQETVGDRLHTVDGYDKDVRDLITSGVLEPIRGEKGWRVLTPRDANAAREQLANWRDRDPQRRHPS